MKDVSASTPVLVSAARTSVGRFGGKLKDVAALDLGATAVARAVELAGGLVPDRVLLGNVIQAGNGQNPARVAATRGGLPLTVPAITLNDVCLASMSAVGFAVTMIQTGQIDTALVGGFDSMSRALHGVQVRAARRTGDATMVDLLMNDGLWCSVSDRGMGEISEEANTTLSIARADQDAFAAASHQRAHRATIEGRLAVEITPVAKADLTTDEGIRPTTTCDILARLRPAFVSDGTITAGNSSQMSDAAAAGIVAGLGHARGLGLTPIVEIVDNAVVAGPDASLHLKPAAAARILLERHGLNARDIGLWEINEAFAGVVLASQRDLDLDLEQVNVNGGAIAVGHPLAASGFRLVQTLSTQMRREGIELGIAAMCGGGGQGQAILLRLLP